MNKQLEMATNKLKAALRRLEVVLQQKEGRIAHLQKQNQELLAEASKSQVIARRSSQQSIDLSIKELKNMARIK